MYISPNEPTALKRRTPLKILDSSDLTGRTGKPGLSFGLGAAPAGCFVKRDINGGGALVAAAGQLIEIDAANALGEYLYEYTQAEVATNLGNSQVILKLAGLTGAFAVEQVDLLYTSPGVVRAGVAQAGSTTSITLDAGASAVDNLYRWLMVRITGGTGFGQPPALITGYVGTTKVATPARAWLVAPDATTTFELFGANVDLGSQAIVASTFATDAVDANALKADAATEIANAALGTAVPGAFGAGTLGKLIGDNVNATISSRAVPGDLMGLVSQAVTTAKFATGAIDVNAVAAAVITAIQSGLALHSDATSIASQITALPSAVQNASALLAAGWTGGSAGSVARAIEDILGELLNVVIDNFTYDPVTGFLLSARKRTFADGAGAAGATPGGSEAGLATVTVDQQGNSQAKMTFHRTKR